MGWDALTGSHEAAPIRADIDARDKADAADPAAEHDTWPAAIGRGVGTGMLLSGPLGLVGKAATKLLETTGATTIPAVSRAIDYLSGGATAAEDAGRVAQVATRAGSLAAQGGALGGATAAVEADPSKPFWSQVGEGAGAGALAGPVVAAAAHGLTYPVRAALGMLPGMVQSNVVNLADRFINQHGIKLDRPPTDAERPLQASHRSGWQIAVLRCRRAHRAIAAAVAGGCRPRVWRGRTQWHHP